MSPTASPPRRTVVRHQQAHRDAVMRRAAGAVLWLALLLVTYWWVGDRGLQDLTAWETGLTSLGRITGLVASVLLLAQVVLMARIPVLERAFGQDDLARRHRLVGLTSFTLMVAHIVLITWGYAGGKLPAAPRTLWELTVDYPGMLLAAAGTLCLVMVVATSVRAARKRLRYESWHLLHLYAYLGVGLALPHQLWTGQQFLGSSAKTVFWWTAWAASAAAIVIWRLAVPVVRSLRHDLRVASVVREAPDVVSLYLTGRNLHLLRVEPGQFLTWRFRSGPGWTRAHPFSLSASPNGHYLRITVKDLGDGSSELAHLAPGTRVLVEGPYGRLSPRVRTRRKVAFIGAGVGITPLRSLAEGMTYGPGEATLLYRYADQPLFAQELEALRRDRGLELISLPGRRRGARSWLSHEVGPLDDVSALRAWVPDLHERDVYVCGPEAWTDAVRRTALAAGLPPEQLHIERFAW